VALAGCAHEPGRQAGPASATGGIRFDDLGAGSGIDYRWPDQPRPMNILESFGRGCGFLDYNGDGRQDALLVATPHPRLYRNRTGEAPGQKPFEEVTAATGLDRLTGDWRGCAAGDVDGDGFVDLLLTGYRRLALLHNDRGRRWADITRQAGLDPTNHGHWASSAGFMDLDADGWLDLVLLNYVVYGPELQQYCQWKPGVTSGCGPNQYRPEYPELWQNVGNGRLRDATRRSGLLASHGKGMVLAFADVDEDGRIDFYVGNDGTPSDLMRNRGRLRFSNTGRASGVAYGSVAGEAISAMGADWGDYDRDGRLDLAVTAFSNQPFSLLRATGPGVFEHVGDRTGVTAATFRPLGFGAKWLDVDNDGWCDLAFADGHVHDNTEQIDPLTRYRQPLILLHNEQGNQFFDLAPDLGDPLTRPLVGRGLGTADYDNDGRVDLLVVDMEGSPLVLSNRSDSSGHWLSLDLRGRDANRFAYGARVTARAGGQVWVQTVSPAASFLSTSDPRIHLGLGAASRLESVTIDWPRGQRDVFHDLAVDRHLVVHEGSTAATILQAGGTR
jgi:hypothetical protein